MRILEDRKSLGRLEQLGGWKDLRNWLPANSFLNARAARAAPRGSLACLVHL